MPFGPLFAHYQSSSLDSSNRFFNFLKFFRQHTSHACRNIDRDDSCAPTRQSSKQRSSPFSRVLVKLSLWTRSFPGVKFSVGVRGESSWSLEMHINSSSKGSCQVRAYRIPQQVTGNVMTVWIFIFISKRSLRFRTDIGCSTAAAIHSSTRSSPTLRVASVD